MKSIFRWYQIHFLGFDLLLSIVFAISVMIWNDFLNSTNVINIVLDGNRSTLYGTLASIFGSLLGFAITAVSIILGFSSSPALAVVRESKYYKTIWDVYIHTIRTLSFTTITCIISLIIDRDLSHCRIAMYFVLLGCIISFLRVYRCIWVLENIIKIITKKHNE